MTAVGQTLGGLLGQGEEGLDVQTGRVAERPDCGQGSVSEALYGGVPAGRGDLDGLSGKGQGVVRFARAKRPPR